ncbi:MAG: GTP cyclohydrolase I [Gammaproteobacteria bacterium]
MNATPSISVLQQPSSADTTAADRIRRRLIDAGRSYHANDNIAPFIEAGELDELREEVETDVREVLHALVIDTTDDHNTKDTARRVAGMLIDEAFRGRYEPAPRLTTFPNVSRLDELMTIGPIRVRSTCSHHFCPILGQVWIGVLPNPSSELIGLSKYARLCEWVMRRPQIQEEAVTMLADELEQRIHADGVAVVMEASHFCMSWRGVKDEGTRMRNTVMRGVFSTDAGLRREFFSQLGRDDA